MMRWVYKVPLRFRSLFRKGRVEQELADELGFHLEKLIQENLIDGRTREEARLAALRQLGGLDQIKEECRDARRVNYIDSFLQDLRYGLRIYRKNPAFTIMATITLALGIGGAATMYSFIEGAVLHPFPYVDSQRLAVIVSRWQDSDPDYRWGFFPVQEFLDYRKQNRVFDEVIGMTHNQVVLTGSDAAVAFDAVKVTGNTFEMLGLPPLMGRTFTPADAEPGAPPVVVLRHKTWQSNFGGDPGIVGRTLVLSGKPTMVIGVMPPRFSFLGADMWVPESFSGGKIAGEEEYISTLGRLKHGVSVEQAAAEAAVLFKGYAEAYPKIHPKGADFSAALIADAAVGRGPHRIFYILFGAVLALLGIACTNVGNLLLARATARKTEIAIRASLGAGCVRLVRQFMVESMLLALGGALLGCLFAWVALESLVAIIPRWEIPAEAVIRINGPVLLFTVGVALSGTLLFGLAPALHAVQRDFQADLRSGAHGASESRGQNRLRNLMVVGEVTLSLVLMTGAGVLMRSFFAIVTVKPGYDPVNVLISSVDLPEQRYKTVEQRNRFNGELLSRFRNTPGVVSVALGAGGESMAIEVTGKPSREEQRALMRTASDSYFETMRIPLFAGRTISEDDFKLARKVVVVNQWFARKYFGGENPLGRQISVKELANPPYSVKSPSFEVVGVTGDIREDSPQQPTGPSMYIPHTVLGYQWTSYVIRTTAPPALLLNTLRREVASLDRELPLAGESLESLLDQEWFSEPRFVTTLMSVFASLGLMLVLIGVYGVLSYSITRRTREIGIRMALGAEAADVRGLVLRLGLRWLLVGIGIGVPASIGLTRILRNRIWGLEVANPLMLAIVAVLLVATGLSACYFPARRATKVDPIVALRSE